MRKLSLTTQIILAIIIGSFLGILLGPLCSVFEPIGKAFVMFIQMVVLLYIPTSIMHGLGSTRPTVARQLFKKGWIFLFFIWGIVFTAVYLMNMLFPQINILFFGTGAHSSFEQNFLNYLVPENPIYDLVNNIVPAIAIFAIIIGIALMHLTHKEPLISFLERVNNTIEQVLKGITIVSPLGVLAIFANFVGNVSLSDLKDFEFYIIPMILIALILTFWVLPALVISCTPLKYREVIGDVRAACFLPFVIGSPSIAIPFLSKTARHYAERFQIKDKELHSTSQMIVPIAYTFTQVGNLFILFFIMFISYYFRHELAGVDQILVSFLTVLMSFGGPEDATYSISFLIDTLGFPKTAVNIYDNASIITQNFQIIISVSSMVAFVILLLLGYYKRLTFRPATFFRHFFIFFFLLITTVFSAKYLIQRFVPFQNSAMTYDIDTALTEKPQITLYKIGQKIPRDPERFAIQDTLQRIYTSRQMYVGYHPNLPPFTYFNQRGELVGFNTALAYKLAYDMNVELIFVPFIYSELGESLRSNLFDIAMSPVLLSEATVANMNFPHYYLSTPNVLIVPRNRKDEFTNFYHLQESPYLVIGVLGHYQEILRRVLPKAKAFSIENIEEIDTLLTEGFIDAMFWTYEQGIDYCLTHPDYVTIKYGDISGDSFLAFPVKFDAFAFIFFLNRWLTIQEHIGFKKTQYDYWMLGEPPYKDAPRWSLLRNVFHLVK